MKQGFQITALILTASLVTVCTVTAPSDTFQTSVQSLFETSAVTETIHAPEAVTSPEAISLPPKEYSLSAEGQSELDKAIEDMETAIATVNFSRRDGESYVSFPYASYNLYDTLTQEQKEAYDIIKEKAENYDAYTFDESLYDDIDWTVAWATVRDENPRLRCYMGIDITDKGTSLFYSIPSDTGELITDVDVIRDKMNTFDAICETVASMIPEDYSTYDKYRVIGHFISARVVYNYDYYDGASANDYTAYSPISGGKTVCAGYAEGYSYICQCADLYCGIMHGDVGSEAHAWNLIALEDGTYHVDICWCDEIGGSGGDWNEYFVLTDEEILKSRTVYGDYHSTGMKSYH